MLAQKRALRLKAMQQNNEFRQLKAMGNKVIVVRYTGYFIINAQDFRM